MRYYLDTSCLIGYSFFNDWWHSDARRLFDSDNNLFIGDTVLFEYCNRDVTSDEFESVPDRSDLSLTAEDGQYKAKMARLWDSRYLFERELLNNEAELDLDSVVELFVDTYNIVDSSEPTIREYFEQKLDELGLGISVENVRKVQKMLVQDLERYAQDRKDEIRRSVELGPERGDIPDTRVETLRRVLSDPMDAEVVCDGSYMCDTDFLELMVTGDKGSAPRDEEGNLVRHDDGTPVEDNVGIYNSREIIHNVTGLRVLYLKDEFA